MKKAVIGLLAVVFVLAILAPVFAEESKENFHAYMVKRERNCQWPWGVYGKTNQWPWGDYERTKCNPEISIRLVCPGQKIEYMTKADVFEAVKNDGSLTRDKIEDKGKETIDAIKKAEKNISKNIKGGLSSRQIGIIIFLLVAASFLALCVQILFWLFRKPKQRDVMPKSLELKINGRKFRYFLKE